MKNEEIILNARLDLMEQGIIKGTGEYITIQDEDGNESTGRSDGVNLPYIRERL